MRRYRRWEVGKRWCCFYVSRGNVFPLSVSRFFPFIRSILEACCPLMCNIYHSVKNGDHKKKKEMLWNPNNNMHFSSRKWVDQYLELYQGVVPIKMQFSNDAREAFLRPISRLLVRPCAWHYWSFVSVDYKHFCLSTKFIPILYFLFPYPYHISTGICTYN